MFRSIGPGVGLGVMVLILLEPVFAQEYKCIGEECQEICQCPESPPCNILGLLIANVFVATPLLLVYLILPAACCFYTCRGSGFDTKPARIEAAPPELTSQFRQLSQESQTSDDTLTSIPEETDILLHDADVNHIDQVIPGSENNEIIQMNKKSHVKFQIGEEGDSIESNALIGGNENVIT
ncbi:uncharacterized protein [Amphiura filiformis]|uniref:uncharacterized protein n=1 Tax=Amphiura filiformis TaxID=82378 RepID=UPI003B2194C1